MTTSNPVATVEHLSARIGEEHCSLSRRWLDRLEDLLIVEAREVFPSHQLLDHIPALILEIASYLIAPEGEEIAANTAVMTKATELGWLRFDQRASVHQLLREFQILAEILEAFCEEETALLGARADAPAAIRAVSRANQAVRVLAQKTVDAFVTRYAETIERQTEQLRNFSRLVSHEIRQPLGVLQVLARIIPVPDDDAEALRLAQTLERNVVRLADVSAKLERLARLTRRTDNAPNEQLVDLSALAHDVARQLADMSDARGVAVHIDDGLPILMADAGRVELAIVNLLANAIKYSDPTKNDRAIHIQWASGRPGPCIQIRDNGIGIPQSKLDKIFDQFVRLQVHLDDELAPPGMGLGLSIVRECMDAMRGRVSVESIEGSGATFVLEWPPEALRDGPS